MPEDVGEDTPLPGLTLEVVDMDVSKNAEFSIFLEPITPNSEVKPLIKFQQFRQKDHTFYMFTVINKKSPNIYNSNHAKEESKVVDFFVFSQQGTN